MQKFGEQLFYFSHFFLISVLFKITTLESTPLCSFTVTVTWNRVVAESEHLKVLHSWLHELYTWQTSFTLLHMLSAVKVTAKPCVSLKGPLNTHTGNTLTIDYIAEAISLSMNWPSVYLHFQGALEDEKYSLKGTKYKTHA